MRPSAKQSGASLIVSLIMLVILTLLVVTAIRTSNTGLRIAGNMQAQAEAANAAQVAIEQVLSTPAIFVTPEARTIAVGSYSVTVAAPECTMTSPVDNGTSADINQNLYVEGSASGAGANDYLFTYWDVAATVTDSSSGATATLHQGVKVVLPASPNPCP